MTDPDVLKLGIKRYNINLCGVNNADVPIMVENEDGSWIEVYELKQVIERGDLIQRSRIEKRMKELKKPPYDIVDSFKASELKLLLKETKP